MGYRKFASIEPTMFLQQAGDTIIYVIFQNLFIEKICRTDLGYDDVTCNLYAESSNDDLPPEDQAFRPVAEEIQSESSRFLLFNSLVENSLPVFLVLFLGVWSDKHKRRKPPLLMCLTGKMVRSFGLLLNAYYLQWPSWVLLFTAALPHSLGGSNAVFHMSAFSYIADSCVPRHRTWRIAIAEFCWQLGAPVGLFLGAYLFAQGGYLYVFGTSFILHAISVIYTAFVLPEVPRPAPSKRMIFGKNGNYGTYTSLPTPGDWKRPRFHSYSAAAVGDRRKSDADSITTDDDNLSKLLSEVSEGDLESASNFSEEDSGDEVYHVLLPDGTKADVEATTEKPGYPKAIVITPPHIVKHHHRQASRTKSATEMNLTVKDLVLGSIKSMLKRRPNHARKCLISIGVIMLLYGVGFNGENSMKYLFTRNKFSWREQQFSNWTVFESCVVVVGLLIVMPILNKLLSVCDPLCGTIAAATRATSKLCVAFAPKSIYLYAASLIDLPGIIGPVTARSLASKLVLRDERGQVFAFLGCIEAIVPLIAVPLYSLIYTQTFTTVPSAIYFFSAAIYTVNFVIFLALFIAYKMKYIHLSSTDFTTLLSNSDSGVIPDTGLQYACSMYRRSSLS